MTCVMTYHYVHEQELILSALVCGYVRMYVYVICMCLSTASEVTSLSSNLPVEAASSIFVRVDEDRPDVIKVSLCPICDSQSSILNVSKKDSR